MQIDQLGKHRHPCLPSEGKPLTRRRFLGAGGLTALAPAILSCSRTRPARPNVLLIVCDDLNDSITGMGGHPQARTPNINRLMRMGVRFTNAHSNAPICAPARACLFSGIYPHHSGIIEFKPMLSSPLLRNSVFLFEHFRSHGYEIWGTGKLYHYWRDYRGIWDNPGGGSSFGYRTEYGPFPDNGKKADMSVVHPSMSFIERLIKDHDSKMWKARGEHCFAPLSDVPAPPKYPGWRYYDKPFRYHDETDRDLMPDELSARWASQILQQPHAEPFLLGVGFVRPHTPLYVPKKYFDLFPLDEIQLPPYKEDDLDDCRNFLGLIFQYGFQRHRLYQQTHLWKRFIQAYLAAVAFADEQIGRLLDALEESRYAGNTIVILTGDHGFHMGEKHYNFKLTNWEEATRVPLVVAAPGLSRKGGSCEHPVSHVDIYRTLVDLCGLPANPNEGRSGHPLDGHSLRPFLEDPQNGAWDGPDVALIGVYGARKAGQQGTYHNFSVRSRRWRYTLYENGAEELYDHGRDPNEWTNLAGDDRYAAIKADLRRKLRAMLGRESRSRAAGAGS